MSNGWTVVASFYYYTYRLSPSLRLRVYLHLVLLNCLPAIYTPAHNVCRKRSVVVIETRVNKRDSQSILAEKVFLFLERRFASADANFTRLFIPVRLFITEDCGVTYLTYFIIVSRIRSEGRQPRPRLILPRILRQVEKCRGEKTR